jgi:hypothetical protein
MNAFNRIFVIVTLVVLLILGAATLISPAFVLNTAQSIADSFRSGFFAAYSDVGRFITRFILAILWVAFIGALLWLQLRRPSSPTIEVARYTGGSAIRISTAAVAEKVQEEVNALDGVIDTKVQATGRNKAVQIKLTVSATRGIDLVSKAEEIAQVTRYVVQDELGLRLTGKPEVAIQPKQGKASHTKTPTPPPSAPPMLPSDDVEASLGLPTTAADPPQPDSQHSA